MGHTTEQAGLPVGVAVRLLHAWCSAQVRQANLRALFIKGPVLADQQLRAPRVSSDVDVLVHPDDFDRVCELLRRGGWAARPEVFAGRFYDDHSISFVHPSWPCDVDVHSRYPGFLADPVTVFERMWSDRDVQTYGHVDCDVSNRMASALILGLHSLRGAASGSRHEAELRHLVSDVVFSAEERLGLANLAAATGCAQSGAPFLEKLSLPPADGPTADVDPAAIEDWRTRTAVADTPVWVWSNAYRHSDGVWKLVVLWRALWPTRRDLEVTAGDSLATSKQRLVYRVARLRRGIPDALSLLRSRRQNRS